MADVPGGTSGMLVPDYKGKEADRVVTRIDPGVAEELGRGRPGEMLWFARGSACRQCRGPRRATADGWRDRLEWDPRRGRRRRRWATEPQLGADRADLPGGASGMLVRDYKGKNAARLVTRIDCGLVSLVAELRGHERQAAAELGQWKAHHEERKSLDASPAAISLAMLARRGTCWSRRPGDRGWMA
jgi:hypothetical protein